MNHSLPETLAPGTRVCVRGEECTVVSVTRHLDCDSVRLRRNAGAAPALTRTLLRPFDRLVRKDVNPAPRIVTRRRWTHSVLDTMAASLTEGGLASAAAARIDLLPFQLEPALAMIRHGHARVLLADAVGLGKTVQAGILLNELSSRRDAFRALILVPAGLREQWCAELRERFSLEAVTTSAAWLASRSRDLPPDVNPWALPGIYLASLDLVKRPEVLRAIEDVSWDLFILDEAHSAAVGTARLAAASAVGSRSRRVLLITATPPDGDPHQTAALQDIGRLSDDEPVIEFRRTRNDAGVSSGRRTVMLAVRLSREERRMHRLLERYAHRVWAEAARRQDPRARLVSVMLRKRALSCASSLGHSISRRTLLLEAGRPVEAESQLLLPLDDQDVVDDQANDMVLAAPGLTNGAAEREFLKEIESAAHAAGRRETKTSLLLRFLRRLREPAIVFTEYRDTLLHLERTLRSAGFDPLLLHGGMLAAERAAVQRAFNQRGRVLLATDAASEGLNLHARCRLVVHFELPWTPARLEQRTGRVDRLGQRRKVHELLLVSRHTAERLVLGPLIRRARAAVQRTGSGRGATALLTESQITRAMMGGEVPGEAPLEPPAMQIPIDVRHEAIEQTGHIAFRRQVPVGGRPAARIVASCQRKIRGITLVYLASLENSHGTVLRSTPVALQLPAVGGPRNRRATELRAWLERFERHDGAHCESLAEASARAELDRASTWYREAQTRLAERERALARKLPSTAQRLVQAGLFDTRALRQASARQRTAALLSEESDEHAMDDDPAMRLSVRIRLVAVRFGGRR